MKWLYLSIVNLAPIVNHNMISLTEAASGGYVDAVATNDGNPDSDPVIINAKSPSKFAVRWPDSRLFGRGLKSGWRTAFLFMKKYTYTEDQRAELSLSRKFPADTLLAAGRSALRKEIELDMLEKSIQIKGSVLKVPLPPELRRRMEAVALKNGKNVRVSRRSLTQAVVVALDMGLTAIAKQN